MSAAVKKALKKEEAKKVAARPENAYLAVVRLRGKVGLKKAFIITFVNLRLHRENHCVIIKNTPENKGMLQKIKDYATYGEVSEETIKALIDKRGRKIGNLRLDDAEKKELLKQIKAGKIDSKVFKPLFRLRPASKGLKNKKQHFPMGDLGYRGESINDLLVRMI